MSIADATRKYYADTKGPSGSNLKALGFDQDRINEIKSYAQGLGKDHSAFGYSADTEQHWKETGNPTKEGSIQADMRKIGEHLGYEHAGTLNHQKVKDFILAGGEEAKTEPEDRSYKLSETAAKAKAYTQAYEDKFLPNAGDYMIKNDQKVAQDFMNEYKLNLKKELKTKTPDASTRAQEENEAVS